MKKSNVLLIGFLLIGGHSSIAEDSSKERIIETYGYKAREEATGIERGRQVYVQWCAICHETGPGMAGTEGLMRKYRGQVPALLREREDLTGEYVTYVVRNGIASMPGFRKTEVSDGDLSELLRYLTEKQ